MRFRWCTKRKTHGIGFTFICVYGTQKMSIYVPILDVREEEEEEEFHDIVVIAHEELQRAHKGSVII